MKTNYSEQLKSPKWQKKRLEIMQRDDFKCVLCMNEDETLAVHHKKYINGRDVWDYDNEYLITLCQKCHDKIHGKDETIKKDNELKLKFGEETLIKTLRDNLSDGDGFAFDLSKVVLMLKPTVDAMYKMYIELDTLKERLK